MLTLTGAAAVAAALHRAYLLAVTVASTLLLLLPMLETRTVIALLRSVQRWESPSMWAALAGDPTDEPQVTNHAVSSVSTRSRVRDPSRRRRNLIWLKLVRTEGRARRRVATASHKVTAPGDTRFPATALTCGFVPKLVVASSGIEVAWGRVVWILLRFRAKTWPQARLNLAAVEFTTFSWSPRQPGGCCRTGVPYPLSTMKRQRRPPAVMAYYDRQRRKTVKRAHRNHWPDASASPNCCWPRGMRFTGPSGALRRSPRGSITFYVDPHQPGARLFRTMVT